MIENKEYDVFLCHNTEDKPFVREVYNSLVKYGLNPWFDEKCLRPGLSFIDEISEQIQNIRVAAVFVGKNGLGPWHRKEINAILIKLNSINCPIIPVILPDCPEKPELPVFLEDKHWVDFGEKQPDPLEQLVFGITGKRTENRLKAFSKDELDWNKKDRNAFSISQEEVLISYCSENDNVSHEIKKLMEYFEREGIQYNFYKVQKIDQNIDKYIKRVSSNKYVVMFINDDYFKSWDCMKQCVKVHQEQIKKDNIYCFIESGLFAKMKMPAQQAILCNEYRSYWENERIELIKNDSGGQFKHEDETLGEITKNIKSFIELVLERNCFSSVEEYIADIDKKRKKSDGVNDISQMKNPESISALKDFDMLLAKWPDARREKELRETSLRGAFGSILHTLYWIFKNK